jgi:UDP-glucuronate 4-epimerase
MRILVTGGAGFIGSHVVDALLKRGDEVCVVDVLDDYYPPAIKLRNMAGFRDQVRLVQADLRDRAALEAALHGQEAVIHLAARAGVRPSILQPELYVDNNVRGTQILLDAMASQGVQRLVYASSSSVYGARSGAGAFVETDSVQRPVSPYAATKLAGELLIHAACATGSLQASCLRLFTVYGPRQRPEMAIHLFARKALQGQAITRFGTGGSLRDYTYVGDIVRGLVAALDRPSSFQVYNLGSARPITLTGLLAALEEALGVSLVIEELGDQPGDVPATWACIDKARAELDWEPEVRLEQGLASFREWLLSTG